MCHYLLQLSQYYNILPCQANENTTPIIDANRRCGQKTGAIALAFAGIQLSPGDRKELQKAEGICNTDQNGDRTLSLSP